MPSYTIRFNSDTPEAPHFLGLIRGGTAKTREKIGPVYAQQQPDGTVNIQASVGYSPLAPSALTRQTQNLKAHHDEIIVPEAWKSAGHIFGTQPEASRGAALRHYVECYINAHSLLYPQLAFHTALGNYGNPWLGGHRDVPFSFNANRQIVHKRTGTIVAVPIGPGVGHQAVCMVDGLRPDRIPGTIASRHRSLAPNGS